MSKETGGYVRSLFADAAPRYDTVVRAATIGMDLLWKRNIFAVIPDDREYDRILDLACGTGIVTIGLARRYPEAEIVGLDVSPEMLSIARDRTVPENVRFVEMPAEEMVELGRDSFDLVTGSYLPKYTDIERLAANTMAVLNDNGVAVFHDFTYPEFGPYVMAFEAYWTLLKRLLQYIEGYDLISAELRELIVSASEWPTELGTTLRQAGLDTIEIKRQPLEVAAIVVGYNEVGS